MTSLTEFFSRQEDDNLKGISHKNNLFKRNIIAHMAVNGECTLSELTKELHISVPTITKLVQELVQENIVSDLGKVETPGGRRPNVFGLASSAIYFAGVNIGRDNMSFLITDLHNNIVKEELLTDFELQDRPQCLEKICSNIAHFIDTCGVERAKILGVGVSVSGRVNPTTGRSYRYFTSSEQSLRDMIEQRIGIRVLLENDSRARCYAEYTNSKSKDEMDVLYLHLGRGLAIGIVMNGKLYYGKSGFAGEFGHIPFFDNEIICSCGKKGCLETEVSGIAIEQKFGRLISQGVNTILREKYNKHEAIHVDEIIDAAKHDDNLSIELIDTSESLFAIEGIGFIGSRPFEADMMNPNLNECACMPEYVVELEFMQKTNDRFHYEFRRDDFDFSFGSAESINPDSPGLRLSADNLYFNAPNPDRLTASLADTSGRIVAAATMEDGMTAINVAQLPEGIYIATLKSDKELILSEKILVSHR